MINELFAFHKYFTVFLIVIFSYSCEKPNHILRKLSLDERIERAKTKNRVDINQVIYIYENGDTITSDSMLTLDKTKMAFDDYVNQSGIVVQTIIRKATPKDSILNAKILQAFLGINGNFSEKTINSTFLRNHRNLSIYTPRIYNSKTPIIYMTDGESLSLFTKKIDKLIEQNVIHPVILIGLHSGDTRFVDYLPKIEHKELFLNFQKFYINDIIDDFESENYGPSQRDRYLFGYSNGAAFSVYTALKNPTLFKEVIAFSIVGITQNANHTLKPNINHNATSFYIGAGRLESEINSKNKLICENLIKNGYPCLFIEFNSGHEFKEWEKRFYEYLQATFTTCKE